MYDLPLHPAIVHLPLALAMLVPLAAGSALLAWKRGWIPRRVWWAVVGLQILLVGSGLLAQRTGEAAEEHAEHTVSEQVIEEHAERAELFLWASGGLLVLLAAAGAVPRERLATALATAGLLGSLGTAGLALTVGHRGGEIVFGPEGPARALGGPQSLMQSLGFGSGEDDDDDSDD